MTFLSDIKDYPWTSLLAGILPARLAARLPKRFQRPPPKSSRQPPSQAGH
ncbi:hypothetical protein [Methyloceanibacter stevinii]|nr:hypothetical protein [Methyloceanibacter stevinii]